MPFPTDPDTATARFEHLTGAEQGWLSRCRDATADGSTAAKALLKLSPDDLQAFGMDTRHSLRPAPVTDGQQLRLRTFAEATATALAGLAVAAAGPRDSSAAAYVAAAAQHWRSANVLLPEEVAPAARFAGLLSDHLAGTGPRKRRSVAIHVVLDLHGDGAAAQLRLALMEGGPAGLFPDPARMAFAGSDDDFAAGLHAAWASSPMPGTGDCVYWSITEAGAPINDVMGGSAAAAFGVALRELDRRRHPLRARSALYRLRPSYAVTGALGMRGEILTVTKLPSKVAAAQAATLHLVAPKANMTEAVQLAAERSVRISFAADVTEAARQVTRIDRRRVTVLAAVIALLPLLATVVVLQIRDQRRQTALAAQAAFETAEQLTVENPELARQLYLSAARLADTPPTRAGLLRAYFLPGLAVLRGQTGIVRALTVAPDGRLAASADDKGRIFLWDLAARQLDGEPMKAGGDAVTSLAFSPDGRTLASAGDDQRVWFWDVATRRLMGEPLTSPEASFDSVAFSPDGRTVVTGSTVVELWNVADRQRLRKVTSSDGLLTASFDPTGKHLLTCGNEVRWWDLSDTRSTAAGTLLTDDRCYSAALSPDGHTVASAHNDDQVRLWDVRTGKAIGAPLIDKSNGLSTVFRQVSSVAFSSDGSTLAVGMVDNVLRIWDVAQRRLLMTPLPGHTGSITVTAFIPGTDTVLSGDEGGALRLWRLELPHDLPFPTDDPIAQWAVSGDGATFLTVTYGGVIQRWDLRTRRPALLTKVPQNDAGFAEGGLQFSHSGKLLATADASRKITVRDAFTGKPVGSPMAGSQAPIRALAFSPDDTLLASTGDDDTVRLWNVATSKEIWHSGEPDQDAIDNPAGDLNVVAFSTDGQIVLAAGAPEEKFAWATASGRSLGNPRGGRNGTVEGLASPAGEHHLSVTQSDALRLWGISSADGGPAVIDTVQGITKLAPGRNNQMLAVGNVSGAVQLWSTELQQPIGPTILAHADGIQLLTFVDGGLVTLSFDAKMSLWPMPDDRSLDTQVCGQVVQQMSSEEWESLVETVPKPDICPPS